MEAREGTIGDYAQLIDTVLKKADALGIYPEDLVAIDHLAYRTSSHKSYEKICGSLISYGEKISENMISGRPIAVYMLREPIRYQGYTIPAIEVMAPKEGDTYADGLEHLEFVIAGSIDNFLQKYPRIDFLTHDLNRKTNPVVTVKCNEYSFRFHTRNLIAVALEQQKTGEI